MPCEPDCWLRQDPRGKPDAPIESIAVHGDTPLPKTPAQTLYQPLESWQTRLIELQLGRNDGSLSCKLFTADLIQFEGFGVKELSKIVLHDALSYSWGYPSMTFPLLVNGVQYLVTPHLASALKNLRYENEYRYLWIYALCNDQGNDVEKTAQVKNMLMVFQKAQRVVVWLGGEPT